MSSETEMKWKKSLSLVDKSRMVEITSIPYTPKKRKYVKSLVFITHAPNKANTQKAILMLPTSPAKHFAFFLKLKNRKTKLAKTG